MGDVTPIRKRRRYTARTKHAAIVTAEITSTEAAAKKLRIPRQTIQYWQDQPQFSDLRQKTRERLAEGSILLAALAQRELQRRIEAGEIETRDLVITYGVAIDKGQLLAGEATTRTEHRDVSDNLSDVEREKLSADIEEWLATSDAAEPG